MQVRHLWQQARSFDPQTDLRRSLKEGVSYDTPFLQKTERGIQNGTEIQKEH